MFDFLFGKKKRSVKKRNVGKGRKPPANIIRQCKRYRIKVTRKVGRRRIYKSITLLKRQIKKRMKSNKSRFGATLYKSIEKANKKCGGAINVEPVSDGKQRWQCNTGTKIYTSEAQANKMCGNYNHTKITTPRWKCKQTVTNNFIPPIRSSNNILNALRVGLYAHDTFRSRFGFKVYRTLAKGKEKCKNLGGPIMYTPYKCTNGKHPKRLYSKKEQAIKKCGLGKFSSETWFKCKNDDEGRDQRRADEVQDYAKTAGFSLFFGKKKKRFN